jgi:hypothetical protein
MNKKQAMEWYHSVRQDGLGDVRDNYFENFSDMEQGFVGELAKRLCKERDDNFFLGLEYGVMIALDKIYGFQKENKS